MISYHTARTAHAAFTGCISDRVCFPSRPPASLANKILVCGPCRRSCETSIAELGCGYLDLLLIHWPHAWVRGTQQEDTSVTLLDTW